MMTLVHDTSIWFDAVNPRHRSHDSMKCSVDMHRSLFDRLIAAILSIAVATAGHADEPAVTIGQDGGPRQAEAAEPGDASGGVTVVSEGVGVDVESAKLDAYRNAVRQTVGAYVDATTLVANDKLITDEIISLSGAYVSKVEVLPGSVAKDGPLTRVRVKAQIEKGKVLTALHERRVPTTSRKVVIDADSIVAELSTKEDRLANAEKLLAKLFDGYPQKCFKASIVGDLKPTKQEGDDVELLCRVRIEANVEAWADFSKALREVLAAVAVKQDMHTLSVRDAAAINLVLYDQITDLARYRNASRPPVPLLDPATLAVHSGVLNQEARCIGIKAMGRLHQGLNGQFVLFDFGSGGWNDQGWIGWPKEHVNVAVLVGNPAAATDELVWDELSVPATLAGVFPRHWPFDPDNIAGRPTRPSGSRIHFNIVLEDGQSQVSLQKGFCQRVGFQTGSKWGSPWFVAPCFFLAQLEFDPVGTATGIEFTTRFRISRSLLATRPKLSCVLE